MVIDALEKKDYSTLDEIDSGLSNKLRRNELDVTNQTIEKGCCSPFLRFCNSPI